MYKYGGFYSDLDTISFRSIAPLLKTNGLGYAFEYGSHSINQAFLIFRKKHQLIEKAIEEIKNSYKADVWSFNGPMMFLRVIPRYCNVSNIFSTLLVNEGFEYKNELNNFKRKFDLVIYPQNYFYPINWNQYNLLFKKNSSLEVRLFKNSYSIHFHGRLSESMRVRLNDNSIYEYFASLKCPNTYDLLKLNKSLFI